MTVLAWLWRLLVGLVTAAGEFFRWLNRRQQRREREEVHQRVADLQQAAAKPNAENADRINAWLHRGRAGRLRRSGRLRDDDAG